jgi:hypothetical protein
MSETNAIRRDVERWGAGLDEEAEVDEAEVDDFAEPELQAPSSAAATSTIANFRPAQLVMPTTIV